MFSYQSSIVRAIGVTFSALVEETVGKRLGWRTVFICTERETKAHPIGRREESIERNGRSSSPP
jgi:hypothetical protein